ncbi:pre-mRNA branch site p14-like protein-like protein [Blastocladiella britannica]|nr:pre-mRNA branch site p14-like protein-like protein [Blastocladiella britannica]
MAAPYTRTVAAPRLAPEVNRILFVRNLPFKATTEELYDLFGKYGAIRQIRVGDVPDTRGTGYVVYEDIYDAKNACEHLSGYNFGGRYLIVLYFQAKKLQRKLDLERREKELSQLKEQYGLK